MTDLTATIEYGDYECGYCAVAFSIVQQVQVRFSSRLKFVFRHLPLTDIHPLAEGAAEAAEFAGAHGKFWKIHSALYQNRNELRAPLYSALAESEGLIQAGMRAAVANRQFDKRINVDLEGVYAAGYPARPHFLSMVRASTRRTNMMTYAPPSKVNGHARLEARVRRGPFDAPNLAVVFCITPQSAQAQAPQLGPAIRRRSAPSVLS